MKRKLFLLVYSLVLLGIGFSIGRLSKQYDLAVIKKSESLSTLAASLGQIAGTHLESEKVTVKRVIDGDTIELTDGRKLRYIGIDTPETVDPGRPTGCFGQEATDKNRELVLNKEIELEKDVSETDRFGRFLRYVYVEVVGQGRVMVNEFLVKEGFAVSSTHPPDVKYQELLRTAERQAQAANKGLWANCDLNAPDTTVSTETSTEGVYEQTRGITANADRAATDCVIKGNISTSGDKIYHLPGCGSYEKTVIDETSGERMFCTEEEAVKEGWRKAKNC